MNPTAKPARIRCIDWLRGLAVLVMIETHSLILLSNRYDGTPLRDFLNGINGLVAPSFLFAAGFALTLVSSRAASDPAAARSRTWKSLRRIGEVLLVGKGLTWYFHSYEPEWWWGNDVLSCIALSLLVLWLLLRILGGRPRVIMAVAAVFGISLFAVAQQFDHVESSFWRHLVHPATSWEFGVIPWAGYVLLGGAAGAAASLGPRSCGWALAAVFGIGLVFQVPGFSWTVGNAGERFMKFGGVALLLWGLEQIAARKNWTLRNPAIWVLETFGFSSLTAYATHLFLIAFPIPRLALISHWPGTATWGVVAGAVLYLWVATLLVCHFLPKVMDLVLGRRKPA